MEGLLHDVPAVEHHLAGEIAELIQSGDPRQLKQAQWTLFDEWMSDEGFADLLREILDCLKLYVSDWPNQYSAQQCQRKKLRRVVRRATGRALTDFICTGESHYQPSAREIADECQRIRAGWSKDEKRARWANPAGWIVPKCCVSRRPR